ncbi:flagellar basal body-associated protein FliL [Pedobacter cryoconitis]|uniref:Flagellar basal body-associated protein FliL n=1 Tax=Pedobacter cryoconitis TaxID=188932 RepID=A0A7W9DX45_9SPHI|nr:hypothetical protein [Pedobacter cryoconitis]MBB5634732.1 flagellar basal body-associated protein FliL [Pedobacter cryoconitis]MBB6272137.1 flagellar basal body-associated protein FliL [Pedobacter cryoconitis]
MENTNSGSANVPQKKSKGKFWTILILFVILFVAGFTYYRYFFVFGEGVKAGQLNYFVKKGYIFKTNEGRLIQTGIRSQAPGNIASNEFMFSVTNDRVAEQLSRNAGSNIEVHYKEYKSPLPWRGVSVFVVDSLISAAPGNGVNLQN